jgi:hypothetical protein
MPLEGFTWHGCPRLPALHRDAPRQTPRCPSTLLRASPPCAAPAPLPKARDKPQEIPPALTSNPAGSARFPPTVSAPCDSPRLPLSIPCLGRALGCSDYRCRRWPEAPVHGRPPLCLRKKDSFALNPLQNHGKN